MPLQTLTEMFMKYKETEVWKYDLTSKYNG